jgi:Na+/H+ antiporter NhaD/arsenite permease-like protein
MVEMSSFAPFILIVFILGYACITLEHVIKVNKTTIALLTASLCWIFVFLEPACPGKSNLDCFMEHLSETSQIVFFLMGALTIVELISLHKGFKVIADYIPVASKKNLLWIFGIVAFFLSSVLDNLTTTIVMVTLLQKLVPASEDRLKIGGAVVIAANAGGVWTPIGDVTTTMLWIGGRLGVSYMMKDLFFPSFICLIVSLIILSFTLKGNFPPKKFEDSDEVEPYGKAIFFLGLGTLIFVPIFKVLTGLPPFMGMLFGLALLWLFTDIVHQKRKGLRVPKALSKIDLPSTLFFLAILICIDALERANILENLSIFLDKAIGDTAMIATFVGFASAVVDNVPLVAASMQMYDVTQHPPSSLFWELIAFCAGTGGSMLIIGSAAGVVFMGIEEVDFFWYLKKISFAAFAGYIAGIGAYLLFIG